MVAGRLKNTTNRRGARAGSALILTVVLTSLLAIVGVLLVMVTRIDKMATSAASENRELTFAVNTIAAQISELLAQDVPGGVGGQDYYDFPDAANAWLADLEPYRVLGTDGKYDYYWRQVSRIAGDPNTPARDVLVDVIGQRDPIVAVTDVNEPVTNADADGDGVGDAQWFEVPGIMSSRGRPIYAAVRVIDNGGMLNVNTGYWFDPNRADPSFFDPSRTEPSEVDGSSPLQINAIALADGDRANPVPSEDRAAALLAARRVVDLVDGLSDYEKRVIWGYLRPSSHGTYTPFDLSDELELRYRFLLDHLAVNDRVESWGQFKGSRNSVIHTPVYSAGVDLDDWFFRACDVDGVLDPNYAYRHVATTYNMDRVITRPADVNENEAVTLQKMVNVNGTSENAILNAITLGLFEPGLDTLVIEAEAAQIAANLIDYIDDDDLVTAIDGSSASGARYYGFERPCIYISEIAHNAVTDPLDPGVVHHSYAIELHKPYFEDHDPVDGQWQLVINTAGTGQIVQPIVWSGLRRFHVLLAEDPLAELFDDSAFADPEEPADPPAWYGYRPDQYANPTAQALDPAGFGEGATFRLERRVLEDGRWLTVDFWQIPRGGWMAPDQGPHSVQRDISPPRCIRKLWTDTAVASVTLGSAVGQYVDPNEGGFIQAHPANRTLRNIGELGMVFATSAYGVTRDETAESVLLNLTNPAYAELFNYLTVIDPAEHVTVLDPNEAEAETRIMGRININTAPWFVLAQLPWIQYQDDSVAKSTRARAIVDYREVNGPYKNIGELMQVSALHDLAYDDGDNLNGENPRGPDLTRDSARNDLEERDLLFTRMSNLVTVRSDVFTAYILVRIGTNGSQKRMIAIFDRSLTGPQNPEVRIVALHPVADPR